MKKILSFAFFLLSSLCYAQSWIDVTDEFISNPRFDNNDITTGWGGTGFGAANPMENAEHWNRTFNTYQTIQGLPAGEYRLSVQAFYRMGNASDDYSKYTQGYYTDYQNAKLYATSSVESPEVNIVPISSGVTSYSLGGSTKPVGDRYYVPNNMEAAYYWFNAGYYWNTLTVNVGDDGVLTIGVRKNTTISNDWMCLDNWTLEYNGTLPTVTTATPEQVIINEIMPANIDMFVDPSWNYGGWLELYNPTDEAARIKSCWISDDVSNLKKTQLRATSNSIPAHGFLNLWFDYTSVTNVGYVNTQIDMKLDVEGGTIYISDDDGTILAQQTYPASIARCSYARTTDGGEEWGYTSTPTPAATNAGSSFAFQRLSAPVVSRDGGMLTAATTFSVTIPSECTLIYTTDGSTPSLDNGYESADGQFEVNSTTVYRFGLFREGYLPSPIVTRSFIFKNHGYYLPVISVVTNPDNLFDSTIGIFTKGTNGITGNGRSERCNWNMDWERPVNMEFFVPNDEGEYCVMLNQECDIEIAGGWSRSMYGGWGCTVDGKTWELQSSVRIKADKKYEGVNVLDYPVFPQKPHNKYKVWQVRNGGNDTYRMWDAGLAQVVLRSGFNVDVQDCQPAHVFYNGDYLGMLNIRESNNKHYGYSNFGIDTDDMDQFDLSNARYNQKTGDDIAWNELVSLSAQLANSPDESIYEEICKRLDIDEYCNYMALECFLGSSDWITNTNNVKGYRCRSTDGKFRFVFFDCDAGYSWTDMTSRLLNNYWGNQNVDDLFRNLMQYQPFVDMFVTAFCIVDGSVLDPDAADAIVSEMYNRANTAMTFEGKSSSTSIASKIRNEHNGSRISNLKSTLSLGSSYGLTLSCNVPGAKLLLNDQEIPTGKFSGKVFSPFTLTAKAPAGYKFVGWKQEGGGTTTSSETVFDYADNWYYYDQGSLDSQDWTALNYTHSRFSNGQAPFGYASSGKFMATSANTTLSYGSSSNKRPTYYFIRHFNINSRPSDDETYVLNYKVDDGVRIHVNGTDIGGYHCNQGAKYSDYATAYEGDNPYEGFISIPASYLRLGDNVIAVEVHNTSASSSDIYFDASLVKTKMGQVSYASQDAVYPMSDYQTIGTYTLQAVFEPASSIATTPVCINEVSAGNEIQVNEYCKKNDWLELYNSTSQPIDVAGMYLSDTEGRPQKYRISGSVNTVIPAYGHLLVWCDELQPISQLHAPFKLSNADGAVVTLQAEDGSWVNRFEYREQQIRQTYGRYPDGANTMTIMEIPSAEKENRVTFYQSDMFEKSSDDFSITLALNEGWNWTSHNLSTSVDWSRFTSFADRIRCQETESYRDEEYGWMGSLKRLEPAVGYKLQMNKSIDVLVSGRLYDVAKEVSFKQGWNWIGVPLYNATTISAAFANYTPTEGDMIVGQSDFATYSGESWNGTLTSLTPGQAYLLKCGKAQKFCWTSLTDASARSRRYAQRQSDAEGSWSVDIHAYPNVMNIIGTVTDEELTPGCTVAAFCEDECRGIGKWIDDRLYMNIHGEGGEQITFRILTSDGTCYDAAQTLTMKAQTVHGTVTSPYLFSLGETTEIATTGVSGRTPLCVTYYNLNGQQITAPTTGVFVEKLFYDNGIIVTRKIMK